jgi:hypothetical protein
MYRSKVSSSPTSSALVAAKHEAGTLCMKAGKDVCPPRPSVRPDAGARFCGHTEIHKHEIKIIWNKKNNRKEQNSCRNDGEEQREVSILDAYVLLPHGHILYVFDDWPSATFPIVERSEARSVPDAKAEVEAGAAAAVAVAVVAVRKEAMWSAGSTRRRKGCRKKQKRCLLSILYYYVVQY